MSNRNMNLIIEGLNTDKSDKAMKIIVDTLKDFVNEFYKEVSSKCGIKARYSTESDGFYMDYSCLNSISYSKTDAKKALNIFKKYANIITMQLDILKMQYSDIEYEVSKTVVSSAKIGKGLYVFNFPFKLKDEYVEK